MTFSIRCFKLEFHFLNDQYCKQILVNQNWVLFVSSPWKILEIIAIWTGNKKAYSQNYGRKSYKCVSVRQQCNKYYDIFLDFYICANFHLFKFMIPFKSFFTYINFNPCAWFCIHNTAFHHCLPFWFPKESCQSLKSPMCPMLPSCPEATSSGQASSGQLCPPHKAGQTQGLWCARESSVALENWGGIRSPCVLWVLTGELVGMRRPRQGEDTEAHGTEHLVPGLCGTKSPTLEATELVGTEMGSSHGGQDVPQSPALEERSRPWVFLNGLSSTVPDPRVINSLLPQTPSPSLRGAGKIKRKYLINGTLT